MYWQWSDWRGLFVTLLSTFDRFNWQGGGKPAIPEGYAEIDQNVAGPTPRIPDGYSDIDQNVAAPKKLQIPEGYAEIDQPVSVQRGANDSVTFSNPTYSDMPQGARTDTIELGPMHEPQQVASNHFDPAVRYHGLAEAATANTDDGTDWQNPVYGNAAAKWKALLFHIK